MRSLYKLAFLSLSFGALASCTLQLFPEQQSTLCGGIGNLPCDDGQVCVDDPSDNCDPNNGGADCSGICESVEGDEFCGGFGNIECPDGKVCTDDPNDDCDPNNGGADCGGICVIAEQAQTCGGLAGLPCDEGQVCADDPSDNCDPNNGGADCPGICQSTEEPTYCGGLIGGTCPDGQSCVDDPSDSCDPSTDMDCSGICQPTPVDNCDEDADCDAGEYCDLSALPFTICLEGAECGVCAPIEEQAQSCGGLAGVPCENGEECVDDTSDDCDPDNSGADCPGICQAVKPGCGYDGDCQSGEFCDFTQVNPICAYDIECGTCAAIETNFCGGFAGLVCAEGEECIDDPNDNCDPDNGGADCGGICIPLVACP